MKAFVTSLIAIAAITVVAAVSLGMLPMSSKETFTENRNVRL